MLYQFYEWNHAAIAPLRAFADITKAFYRNPLNPASRTEAGRTIAAMAEFFERTTRVYGKPSFGLTDTFVDGERVAVADKPVWEKPFCRLLHFERAVREGRRTDPRILIVAPMSGHYATLLRGTVEALLPYADVYITDWTDARQVPLALGRFDLDDYVDYLIEMLHFLGPDTHVVGVCQPAVPVLIATAVMEARGDDCSPSTMTLMGGPIDTRRNPTGVNRLAQDRGIEWFRQNVIMKVPFPQPGFMRDVYPGFLQLTGFMSMNLDRHLISYKDFFWHLVKGDGDSAERHRTFYDEYNAVMDLTAEFYLQTVDEVFIKHSLPKGEMMHRGERVDPSKIRRAALLTVEGELDDISGLGQTEAAQDLCSSIPADKRVHYVQRGVGHYGVFNGSRFRAEVAPRMIDFALTHGTGRKGSNAPAPVDPKAPARAVEELTDRAPAEVSSDSLASAVVLSQLRSPLDLIVKVLPGVTGRAAKPTVAPDAGLSSSDDRPASAATSEGEAVVAHAMEGAIASTSPLAIETAVEGPALEPVDAAHEPTRIDVPAPAPAIDANSPRAAARFAKPKGRQRRR